MGMENIIRSYLVSLGFEVNDSSFNQAKKSIGDLEKLLSSFAGSSKLKFALAGAGITGAIVGVTKTLYDLTVGVAGADLQNQLFAARMWMNVDSATAYKKSLDALGVSMQDLYTSPELMSKFNELNQQALQMTPGGDYEQTMQSVRGITFEFQRLKLEASYAMQWIGYYLDKFLASDLFGIKGGLSGLNDEITKNMPIWTKNVAQVVSWFGRLGQAAYLAGKDIKDIWDSLGDSTKKVVGITTGFFALLKMGPMGWIIAGLTTLLLLINDYYTYEKGGQSALPGLWKWFDQLKKSMQDSGDIKGFKESIQHLADSILNLAKNFGELFTSITGQNGIKVFQSAIKGLTGTLNDFANAINAVSDAIKTIHGIVTGNKKETQQGAQGLLSNSNDLLFGTESNKKNLDPTGKLGLWSGDDVTAFEKKIFSWIKDHIPHKALGGLASGLTLVGEHGPEIANFPNGTQIFTNDNLTRMLDMITNFRFANLMGTTHTVNNYYYQLSSTNHITGTTNPQSTANAINQNNYGLLMRAQQGVIR